MPSRIALFALSALSAAGFVAAQAAPAWQYVPSACSSQCSETVRVSYQCGQQYKTGTDIYGCFCASYPSDSATCVTCLNSNNAAALATLLQSTQTACPTDTKACAFSCAFNTCAATDIACQCSASYLSAIYNCASCNTANGNTAATTLTDFNALQASCKAQNYTGASQAFTTSAIGTAAGAAAYTAPVLTASGGGAAATGGAALTAGLPTTLVGAGASTATTAAAAGAVVAASAATVATGAAGASGVAASGVTAATAASVASAATSSKAAADNLAIPATGLLAIIGAAVAML